MIARFTEAALHVPSRALRIPLLAARAGLDVHHRWVRLPRVDLVADALAGLAGDARSCLDVGPGDGLVGRAIAERLGGPVVGADVSPQRDAAIDVVPFDGETLPFEAGAFDAVILADVLHHATSPDALLREALRVARRAVLVKDHFAFGPLSRAILRVLDEVGNAQQGIGVRGTYLSPAAWLDLVARAGGVVTGQVWPLHIHRSPIHHVTRDELQFAARVVRLDLAAPAQERAS